MFYANRTAMELSDIFHGVMVTLARRLCIFDFTYDPVVQLPAYLPTLGGWSGYRGKAPNGRQCIQ